MKEVIKMEATFWSWTEKWCFCYTSSLQTFWVVTDCHFHCSCGWGRRHTFVSLE